mgnify:CR=1 FL=1
MCATGSIDGTCKIWNVATGKTIYTLTGHTDEVLDINFNWIGNKIATASIDGTVRLYNVDSP